MEPNRGCYIRDDLDRQKKTLLTWTPLCRHWTHDLLLRFDGKVTVIRESKRTRKRERGLNDLVLVSGRLRVLEKIFSPLVLAPTSTTSLPLRGEPGAGCGA